MSMFESNWPTPHREVASRMGRKLGADLVAYPAIGVETRLESVPHLTYEPGQSFSSTQNLLLPHKLIQNQLQPISLPLVQPKNVKSLVAKTSPTGLDKKSGWFQFDHHWLVLIRPPTRETGHLLD
jgi:hypothetical protein